MQYAGALSRFSSREVPTIPDASLAKYRTNNQAAAIDAAPKTETARVREAPMIPDAARSERAATSVWGWTHDPALLVGVAVCFAVWLTSTKLMRRT